MGAEVGHYFEGKWKNGDSSGVDVCIQVNNNSRLVWLDSAVGGAHSKAIACQLKKVDTRMSDNGGDGVCYVHCSGADVTVDGVLGVVTFMYTGQVRINTATQVGVLYAAAAALGVTDLMETVEPLLAALRNETETHESTTHH